MPIALTELTTEELTQFVAVFDALDPLLVLLEEKGIANTENGIDLNVLYLSVFEEDETRAAENAALDLQPAIDQGHIVTVARPDGEIGYSLTDAGTKYLEGLT